MKKVDFRNKSINVTTILCLFLNSDSLITLYRITIIETAVMQNQSVVITLIYEQQIMADHKQSATIRFRKFRITTVTTTIIM